MESWLCEIAASRQRFKIDVACYKYYRFYSNGGASHHLSGHSEYSEGDDHVRILITGNLGYVGSVLTRFLRRNVPGAELIGFDCGFFGHSLTGVDTLPESLLDLQYFGDVRDFPAEILNGIDAVVHLAAISNDPMGNKFEQVTQDVNQTASIRIAELCRDAEVKNFVFASSCSMYGYAESGARKETDPTNPLTAYARSKIGTENALRQMDLAGMTVTSLRFATACGMSDRLRMDLVLNDFVACAVSSGEITVLSDGTPWRPLIDVEDMARGIYWAIRREARNSGEFLAVNVGRDEGNYQVKDLAGAVARQVAGTKVSINTNAPPDKRSYKVDFSLLKSLAPEAIPQVKLEQSIASLYAGLNRMAFSDKQFRNSSYMRLRVLETHISEKRLNTDLRWIKRNA
jgi:nucleoside-diphosphate-sugar epimerase